MRPHLVPIIILVTVCLSGCLDPKIKAKAEIVRVKTEVEQLHSAIHNYNIDYGGELSGTSANIVKVLMGANPRRVVYFETSPKRIAADGSFLDVWGTPYRIVLIPTKFAAPSAIQITSAGPDRAFDTADDITVTKTPK